MPVKPLPPDADLNHLKYQAKDLLKARTEHDPQVAQRIREFHPDLSTQQMRQSSMRTLAWPTRNSQLLANEDLQTGRN